MILPLPPRGDRGVLRREIHVGRFCVRVWDQGERFVVEVWEDETLVRGPFYRETYDDAQEMASDIRASLKARLR